MGRYLDLCTTVKSVEPDHVQRREISDQSPAPDAGPATSQPPGNHTDKTDKRASVSFVSAVSRHIAAGDVAGDGHLSDRTHGSVLPPSGPPNLGTCRDDIPEDWRLGVLALIKLPCPASVRPPRWRRLKLDAAKFYERWGATAAALGWSTHDVFAANRTKPIERVDMAGLVVLINGRKLAALTDSEAVISTRTSRSLTYRRKWIEPAPGQALLWELGTD